MPPRGAQTKPRSFPWAFLGSRERLGQLFGCCHLRGCAWVGRSFPLVPPVPTGVMTPNTTPGSVPGSRPWCVQQDGDIRLEGTTGPAEFPQTGGVTGRDLAGPELSEVPDSHPEMCWLQPVLVRLPAARAATASASPAPASPSRRHRPPPPPHGEGTSRRGQPRLSLHPSKSRMFSTA